MNQALDQELRLTINGKERLVEGVASPAFLDAVLSALALRADRIALELNGELAPRTGWTKQSVQSGDKLEIVHFVGGGADSEDCGGCLRTVIGLKSRQP